MKCFTQSVLVSLFFIDICISTTLCRSKIEYKVFISGVSDELILSVNVGQSKKKMNKNDYINDFVDIMNVVSYVVEWSL